ncbi:MAG: universal stress protein [Rhodocyclaceae bacterium]|nr:universal stress protein [Rhodocyclaceae bacterium]
MSAPIVVATDFSAGAMVALERAAHLALVRQAPLHVLHVFDDGIWASLAGFYASAAWYGADPALTTRQRLADLAGDLALRYGIDARPASASGAAAEEIARFARSVDAALLVVGKQGEHWIADALLGETALKLTKSIALPVLVAHEQTQARIERIIITTDFSQNAFRAAQAALRLFPETDKQLLNAYSVQFEGRMRLAGASEDDIAVYRNLERTRAEAGMRDFAERLGPAQNLTKLVVSGFPAATVLAASARDVDLVVIGRHGGSGIEELLLGSVTRNVLYHAACDVLLVP